MAQKSLLEYSQVKKKPSKEEESKAEAPPTTIASPKTEKKEKRKKRRAFPPIAPENLPPSYFVSATYDGRSRKALIKLYEPTSGKIYFWYDNTGHKPYCLTNLSPYELEKIDRLMKHESFDRFKLEEKFDALRDRKVQVTKILWKKPKKLSRR